MNSHYYILEEPHSHTFTPAGTDTVKTIRYRWAIYRRGQREIVFRAERWNLAEQLRTNLNAGRGVAA